MTNDLIQYITIDESIRHKMLISFHDTERPTNLLMNSRKRTGLRSVITFRKCTIACHMSYSGIKHMTTAVISERHISMLPNESIWYKVSHINSYKLPHCAYSVYSTLNHLHEFESTLLHKKQRRTLLSHALTGEKPCINKEFHALFMHRKVTFNMIVPGSQNYSAIHLNRTQYNKLVLCYQSLSVMDPLNKDVRAGT